MVKSSFSSKCVSLLAGALRSYELGVDPPDTETDEIDASSLIRKHRICTWLACSKEDCFELAQVIYQETVGQRQVFFSAT